MQQAAYVNKLIDGLLVELHGAPAVVVIKATFDGKLSYYSERIDDNSKHLVKYPDEIFKLGHLETSVFPVIAKDSARPGGSGPIYLKNHNDNGIYSREHVDPQMPPAQGSMTERSLKSRARAIAASKLRV